LSIVGFICIGIRRAEMVPNIRTRKTATITVTGLFMEKSIIHMGGRVQR
jgi:hypothetical protein